MKKELKILIWIIVLLIIFSLTYVFPLDMITKISGVSTPIAKYSLNTVFFYYTGMLILFFWITSFMLKKTKLKAVAYLFITNSVLLALGILYFTIRIY